MTDSPGDFWDDPATVARFSARAADHRLQALVDGWSGSTPAHALDVGCAGGRNTVLLARRGFDVHAIDASPVMIAETRKRVAALLGEEAAHERVMEGKMDDLSRFPDASFDLVISLGVLHAAGSWAEWTRAADELVRVLAPGGLLLLSQFTPATDPAGTGPRPAIPGEIHVFQGLHGGRAVFIEPETLAQEMADRGLIAVQKPAIATGRSEEGGQRVSVNALYRRE